jgi:hypothetical protein
MSNACSRAAGMRTLVPLLEFFLVEMCRLLEFFELLRRQLGLSWIAAVSRSLE